MHVERLNSCMLSVHCEFYASHRGVLNLITLDRFQLPSWSLFCRYWVIANRTTSSFTSNVNSDRNSQSFLQFNTMASVIEIRGKSFRHQLSSQEDNLLLFALSYWAPDDILLLSLSLLYYSYLCTWNIPKSYPTLASAIPNIYDLNYT
jgi:hypothetical protein